MDLVDLEAAYEHISDLLRENELVAVNVHFTDEILNCTVNKRGELRKAGVGRLRLFVNSDQVRYVEVLQP